jgi:hypothetical protein
MPWLRFGQYTINTEHITHSEDESAALIVWFGTNMLRLTGNDAASMRIWLASNSQPGPDVPAEWPRAEQTPENTTPEPEPKAEKDPKATTSVANRLPAEIRQGGAGIVVKSLGATPVSPPPTRSVDVTAPDSSPELSGPPAGKAILKQMQEERAEQQTFGLLSDDEEPKETLAAEQTEKKPKQ